MKTNIKYNFGLFFLLLFVVTACSEENYSFGDLKAPNNVVIDAVIVGKDATHPDGDGSGKVNFTVSGNNILGAKIDYNNTDPNDWVILPNSNKVTATFKTETAGVNTYTVTLIASGVGGASTTVTTTVTVLTVKAI
ncbi:hypothetical protein [Flavobacterium sp.]|jgi:hypothetical protein|uniref:hypothetical protein n=1 Tax=Flavobacterium sp. TaxID=239 RepID=UPI0037C192BC